MSQEIETQETTTSVGRARRQRRRSQRPVLVTSNATEEAQAGDLATHTEPLATNEPEQPAEVKRPLRLPNFFSRVAKADQETATSEEHVVKARLARASKAQKQDKSAASQTSDEEKEGSEKKASTKTDSKQAPPRLFKPRHFLGMGIYLFGAQMILPLEMYYMQQFGLEFVFTQFSLFGQQMQISTSLIANIVTLIGCLFLLVKLDLLPSTLTARTAAQARAASQSGKGNAAPKPEQPTVRQGVKGEDDELYQSYRLSQRRDKKR